MPIALLETKLYVPRSRRDLVLRPRLSERLDRGTASKLVLVSAPAGFGKTTLLTEWLAANGFFYVMHRFDVDNVAYAKKMRDKGLFVSLSSGVKPPDYAVIDRLASSRAVALVSPIRPALADE